ncbi:hypothetical protein BC835DRAFT_805127 [Cytidiella melzeri]|nr:hypothetical protein BC835DRAFT_805127 [Cytidiella melzeri]
MSYPAMATRLPHTASAWCDPLPVSTSPPASYHWPHRSSWPPAGPSYHMHAPLPQYPVPRLEAEYLPAILPSHQSPPPESSSTAARFPQSAALPHFPLSSYHHELTTRQPAQSPLQTPTPVSSSPSPAPQPSSPLVKQEEVSTDCFIFEGPTTWLSSHATSLMIEVPLRATGAPRKMRRLMAVYRLDPFAINNAPSRPEEGKDWSGDRIGPLTQRGKEYQFQIQMKADVKPEPEIPSSRPQPADPTPSPVFSSSLEYPDDDNNSDNSETAQPQTWNSPQPVLYSLISDDSPQFDTIPTAVEYLAASAEGGSISSSSPPMRTMQTSPFLLPVSKDPRMQYAPKDIYTRHPPYTASPSLRLPPPTPSSRYISMPQIHNNDTYSDDNWYQKDDCYSSSFYPSSKDILPLASTVSSLANATKYRAPQAGSVGHSMYSPSLHGLHNSERIRYS